MRLFVYGSLKTGFCHHDELAGCELLGQARTHDGFRLVRLGEYPAMVKGSEGFVEGELYRVPVERLPALDEFEDVPFLYQRQEIELADGSRAFAYLIDEERAAGLREVGDGIWREDHSGDPSCGSPRKQR